MSEYSCNYCGYVDEERIFEIEDKNLIADMGATHYCQGCNRFIDFDDMTEVKTNE